MRAEFSKATRREAMTRSQGLCEGILPNGDKCSANLWQKMRHFDHIIPCEIGGGNELSNCQVLCVPCHGAKTQKIDIPMIAKAKRVYDKHNGIKKPRTMTRWRRFDGSIREAGRER
jgi:5-methylcytosine-specific restriction enzyme A